MARFVKGDIVVVPFPFSDLSQSKRRPALILAVLSGDDRILCQITSRSVRDSDAIGLDVSDFQQGALNQPSNVRPNRLFTADEGIFIRRIGCLTAPKLDEVIRQVISVLTR